MKRMLTSCFGLGRLPIAPGTWGSLPPVIIFGLMSHYGASPAMITNVMAALVLAVADEFAGQAVTFLFSPFLAMGQAMPRQILVTVFTGFVLFRLFDISKPWPIRKLEKYPAGWGILADDLLAGVFAWVVLQICIRVFIVV